MGATEEQMLLVDQSSMDHVAYLLILFSVAFIVFLFAHMLIHLYDRNANPQVKSKDFDSHAAENGRVRDAEEFELDGLMSDDEADEADLVVTQIRHRQAGCENREHADDGGDPGTCFAGHMVLVVRPPQAGFITP